MMLVPKSLDSLSTDQVQSSPNSVETVEGTFGLSLKSGAEWSSPICTVMFANRPDHNVQGRFVSASHSGDLHYISQSAVNGTSTVAPMNSRSLESIIVRNSCILGSEAFGANYCKSGVCASVRLL